MAILTPLLGLASLHVVAAHPPAYPGSGPKGAPSPASIGSDLTILTHNDLLGNASCYPAAIVLNSPLSEVQASSACAALGEKLWYPNGDDDFLNYLTYEGKPGPYWIAGHQGPSCKTINSSGKQGTLHCPNRLPALCTQSAPLSNLTYNDNSTTWQTTVSSGGKQITGFRDKYSFRFLGIRYAEQPKRFTYSTPYDASGAESGLDFGSQCVQAGGVGSEDCLFLNVWTPYLPASTNPSPKQLKPVLFWIHGGAFTGGTGSDPTFDGSSLASRGDVVVVTINYRLGTLGFLALEDGHTNGNFGLADQITALEWVHSYIKAFGGDPSRITIAGQSAGAASVRALLASPRAIGKFAAAIPQSNLAGQAYATTYSDYYNISAEVSVAADPILNATGCLNSTSQVDCLRALDPHAIANLTDVARFLVQDGTYLVTPELEVTGKGPAAHVPVMMGFMRDDGAAFISYPTANDSLTSFISSQGFNFTTSLSTSALTTIYPEPNSANATLNIFNTTALVSTDAQFRCLDEATAYSAVKHNVFTDVYFYEFNRSYQLSSYSPNSPNCVPAPDAAHPYGDPSNEYFKCHSGELYYVFGTLAFNGLPARDENDIPFEQFAVDTWAAFVRTYNPNPDVGYLKARGFSNTLKEVQKGGSKWAPVTPGKQTLRLLEWPSVQEPFLVYSSQAQCDDLGLPLDYYERKQG